MRGLLAGLSAAATVAIALAIFAIGQGGSASPHQKAVEQLVLAARSQDEAIVRRLLLPNARLEAYSDFAIVSPAAADLRAFLGPCRAVATSEAMDVVAVRFDCARDRRGEFILDFAFCGDRINTISWPESGRRFLSPLLYELTDAIRRRLAGRPDRCDS